MEDLYSSASEVTTLWRYTNLFIIIIIIIIIVIELSEYTFLLVVTCHYLHIVLLLCLWINLSAVEDFLCKSANLVIYPSYQSFKGGGLFTLGCCCCSKSHESQCSQEGS